MLSFILYGLSRNIVVFAILAIATPFRSSTMFYKQDDVGIFALALYSLGRPL